LTKLAVRIPKKVLDGIETVRQSGVTNMFDIQTVMGLLVLFNVEAYNWVKDNPKKYFQLILEGPEVGD